jgi:NAD(P)H-nitrite reductase large subunit
MTNTTEGAILQRDGRTWAVTTRIPAGIVIPEQLETIAKVGRKYHVPLLKITSGQRILFAGLEPDDVSRVIADLGPLAKPETAPCVKFVQACLGTDMCKYGKRDSIGLAKVIDDQFKDQSFRQRSRSGSQDAPAVAVKAIPGTSGSLRPQKGGQSSSGATPDQAKVGGSHCTRSYFQRGC